MKPFMMEPYQTWPKPIGRSPYKMEEREIWAVDFGVEKIGAREILARRRFCVRDK